LQPRRRVPRPSGGEPGAGSNSAKVRSHKLRHRRGDICFPEPSRVSVPVQIVAPMRVGRNGTREHVASDPCSVTCENGMPERRNLSANRVGSLAPHPRVFLAKSAETIEGKRVMILAFAKKRKRVRNGLKTKWLGEVGVCRKGRSGKGRVHGTPPFFACVAILGLTGTRLGCVASTGLAGGQLRLISAKTRSWLVRVARKGVTGESGTGCLSAYTGETSTNGVALSTRTLR
jgi:hypothetical protein